jgi:hypothetical protein
MTDKEFEAWWHSMSFKGATKAQLKAWYAFLDVLCEELGVSIGPVTEVPPHERERFITVTSLIFG